MSLINKEYLKFDEKDIELMKKMMSKFYDLHRGAGMPDYSTSYVGYLPVFALALFEALNNADKLTKKMLGLTWALVFLTIVIVGFTIVLIFK